MKICIVGKNSKIANIIEKSIINKENEIIKVSQREKIKFNIIENIDTIIYLVSNTSTTPKKQTYAEYIFSNCVLLTEFIIKNEERITNKNFIYFSSAKIYNIFPDKSEYKEDKIEEINCYTKLEKIAIKIIEIVNKMDSREKIITTIENTILPLILELPNIENYYPIYEYTKVISEIIVSKLLKNSYILRPTYLYGDESDNNIIFDIINKAIENKNIIINRISKDFVDYDTLINLLNKIIYYKSNNINVINISSYNNINNEKIINFIGKIEDIIGKKAKIDLISKCNKEFLVNNSKMKEILGNTYKKEVFDEIVKKIIYKLYIEKIEKLEILQEYIGGSYARTYLVKDNFKKLILKISMGNGADNGNEKLKKEAKQIQVMYKFLSEKEFNCLPKIYEIKAIGDTTIIKEEYIEGKTISEYIYDKEINIELIKKYINKMCNIVFSVYAKKVPQKINILEEGINRAKSRLKKVKDTKFVNELFENALTFENIIINDEKYCNPIKLLEIIYLKYKEKFETNLGLCISGDVILDNVIIKNDNPYIIDTRGEDLFWIDEKPYFDAYYDFGKILLYFYGWKSIREEKIEIKTNNYNLMNTNSYIKVIDEKKKMLYYLSEETMNEFFKYKKYINDEETNEEFKNKVNLMAGIHFLSDTYPRIMGKGNKLLECYSEFLIGTIIINKVYNNIIGGKEKC